MNEEYEQVKLELLELIRQDLSRNELRDRLQDYHDADIADVLSELDFEERYRVYRALGTERISDVFSYLDEDAEDFFREIGLEKSADILEEMDADDAVDILEKLPEDYRDMLVRRMDEDAQEDIQLIQSYDDDELGSLMTTNFIVTKRGASIKQAMKDLIAQSDENDNITTIYVENEDGTFYGAIDLKALIRARKDTDLEDIITTSYPTVNAKDKISENIERLRSYSEDSIPVVDDSDRILGVITAFDVVEAVDVEMGEDYARLAGLTAEEDLHEPLIQSIKKRIPWLITLLFLGLVVSTVVGLYEGVIARVALVVSFQSLVLDMAGNGGTQSLAVTIRVISDESLSQKEKFGLVFKEARIGITNGLILGSTAFLFVGLYSMIIKQLPAGQAFAVSACVGISLLIAMTISSLLGTLIPQFFSKIGIDPAVASGPLITTINDLIAVVTYYTIVLVLLINVMGMG